MLRRFFYSTRTNRRKLATSRRSTRRRNRGVFEQLENRAMLSATIGATAQAAEQRIETITDVFVVTPAAPESPPFPIVRPNDTLPPEQAGGDGFGSAPGDDRPQKAMSPDQGLDKFTVRSTVTASSTRYGTKLEVSAKNSDGSWSQFEFKPTRIATDELGFYEHAVAEYAAENTIDRGAGLRLVQSSAPYGETIADYDVFGFGPFKFSLSGSGTSLIVPAPIVRPTYDSSDRPPYAGKMPTGALPLDYSYLASISQGVAAEGISQRAYDAVLQSYLAQPTTQSTDQGALNQLNSFSLTGVRPTIDDNQGGFVELDGSDGAGNTRTSRSAADGNNDAVDAVLAELYHLDGSTKGETNDEAIEQGLADITAGGRAASFDEAAAIGGADQGGMVVLYSAENGHDLVAAAVDQPVKLTVPDSNVHMEAAVGIYQAFDVATGELPFVSKVIPAAAIVPAKKHEQGAKGNASAGKVAKPMTDQASAWVEIVTAAAVIGASKKERKARAKA
jgi:hypothetical protein